MERNRELERKIGERVSVLRKDAKLTQEKLAELTKCSPTFISKVERGESAASIKLLGAIANSLKLPIRELFQFDDEDAENKIEGIVLLSRNQAGRLVEKSYNIVEKHR
jgi:transcriptional regulator with XRE-family HTH domain